MRGKAVLVCCDLAKLRITPAYAGKRLSYVTYMQVKQDHPHVCGEKPFSSVVILPSSGSPPRMRGKVNFISVCFNEIGITPAYAGKSGFDDNVVGIFEDHPRVCGEKEEFKARLKDVTGSPPRMRGKD